MGKYESVDCPICKKPLENGEDIVVCPDCGAPYHKSCYQQTGHCIFTDLHQKNEAWSPAPKTPDGWTEPEIVCPRCGTHNPSCGIFCQTCGLQLPHNTPYSQGQPFTGDHQHNWNPAFPNGAPQNPSGNPPFGNPAPNRKPVSPLLMMVQEIGPDEMIDGISAREYAAYVRNNSNYFLPVFKRMSGTRLKVINWGAFFFTGGYFLYRKMYSLGVLFLLIWALLEAPGAILYLKMAQAGLLLSSSSIPASLSGLSTLSTVCSGLSFAFQFFCGLFANTFYFSHCKRKIAAIKQSCTDEQVYFDTLSAKGNVALPLIIVLLVVAMLLSGLLSSYLVTLLGIG